MKQFLSLLWKEWYETRILFAIALFVFLILPLIGGIEQYPREHIFHISASVWAFCLGGLLAIFMGVGTVSRDFGGGLEDFWRSRPVGIGRWLIVKYFVGLLATLIPLYVPLLLQAWINRVDTELVVEPKFILAWCPFEWAALYSLGFLSACLLRRAAHAAMLAVALALLLYFLPEVFPPIRFLSLAWVMDDSEHPRTGGGWHMLPIYHRTPWAPGNVPFEPGQLAFVVGMIVLCAIALGLAMLVVRRDLRVESSRKLIYWSIGSAVVLVFASASFQVATNLSLIQTIDLSQERGLNGWAHIDGNQGIIERSWWTGPAGYEQQPHHALQPFQVTSSGVSVGPITEVTRRSWSGSAWSPDHPEVIYRVRPATHLPDAQTEYPQLLITTLKDGAESVTVQEFPQFTQSHWSPQLLLWNGRLHLRDGRTLNQGVVLTFDISDPAKPRLISTGVNVGLPAEVGWGNWWESVWSADHPEVIYEAHTAPHPAESESEYPQLTVTLLNGTTAPVIMQEFPQFTMKNWRPELFLWNGHLYMLNEQELTRQGMVLIFDISDALKPRLLSSAPIVWEYSDRRELQFDSSDVEDLDVAILSLPQIPGLPPRQRLEMKSKHRFLLDGDVIVCRSHGSLITFRLEELTADTARFRRAGRYDPTPVQRLFGESAMWRVIANGLLYQSSPTDRGSHISVVDLRDPQRPHPIGHFGQPFEQDLDLCALPEGRALAIGRKKLYVLGAPPGFK
jgi:hypothetical protein